MAAGVCSVDGCERVLTPKDARGLCGKHYQRFRVHGDPTVLGYKYGDDNPATHRRGELHPRWRGDNAGYAAIHDRVKRARGRARDHECVECGGPAAEWAYDNADPRELVAVWCGSEVRYSTDPSHYLPMCVRDHRRFDTVARKAVR